MSRVTPPYDLVTFVTDYGSKGGFVGALHAVVDSITGPSSLVRIIDLDHSIPPQDVLLGALRMERSMKYLRPGVHVGVVDPGVGTPRLGVAVEAGGRVFVGPDNGLLMFAVAAVGGAQRAVAIEAHVLAGRSKTFDGRDVFAPVAAHLACGVDLLDLGPPVDAALLVRLQRPVARLLGDALFELLVVQVDTFGNVQFGTDRSLIGRLGDRVRLRRTNNEEDVLAQVGSTSQTSRSALRCCSWTATNASPSRSTKGGPTSCSACGRATPLCAPQRRNRDGSARTPTVRGSQAVKGHRRPVSRCR